MRSPSCSGFAGKIFNNTSETTVFRLSGLTCISCCTVFRQPSRPHSQKPFDRPEEYPRIRFHPRMFGSRGKSRLMVNFRFFSHFPMNSIIKVSLTMKDIYIIKNPLWMERTYNKFQNNYIAIYCTLLFRNSNSCKLFFVRSYLLSDACS